MEVNADVENFFSRFDKEETVDSSESLPDNKEEDSLESKEVATKEETKEDDSKTTNKEKSEEVEADTPFHKHPRWQAKLAENKKLRDSEKEWAIKFEDMQKQIESLKSAPKTDDEIEAMTPKEAMEYQRELLEAEYANKNALETKEKDEADKYISETLSDLKDEWHEFDENELLKIASDYTEGDLNKAFDLYQRFNDTKQQGADKEAKRAAKSKAADSNSWNRGGTWKVTWFVSWGSWDNLRHSMK